MAYNTKTVKRDGSGITPVPQHFNPTADDYEPIYGRNNAGRVEIYGPDGNPISTDDSNKLAVRASEIETILNEIKSKDFATQTTLSQILAKIIAAPATEAKQDTLIGHVDGVESALAAILAKLIAAPATEAKQDILISHVDGVEAVLATLLTKAGFDAKADISLTALRDALRGTGSKTLTDLANALVPLATAAKQDTLAGLVSTAANQTALQNLIGTLDAAAVTDPTASAALIQLLKGLLKQLQGGGTGAAPVQLTGSEMEVYGASLNDRPDATTVPIGATFTIVDASQDFKTWMSNGVDWGEEI